MLVYDDRSYPQDARRAWREIQGRITQLTASPASHDDVLSALIAFGEYESALADALCGQRDDLHPTLVRLRAISEWLGQALAASTAEDRSDRDRMLQHARRACLAEADPGCGEIQLKTPEGYAYYGLYPESYADAVVEWATRERPAQVAAIGLRSIGTSLSAVVTGALRRCGVDTRSWTLRPRGHPFDRHIEMTSAVAATLLPPNRIVLIVDEGPGLSGSSMTATAAALSELGVPERHILFVPSWSPDPSAFVSPAAANRWARHRAIVPSFERVRRSLAVQGVVPGEAREVSAGAWREALDVVTPWPAVNPQHERRKFLFANRLARFAGLGSYGEATFERANALADAKWSPRPLTIRRGFLTTPLVAGTSMHASDATVPFVRHAAAYIAWLRSHTANGRDATTLSEMLLTNTREALGPDWLASADTLIHHASTFSEPVIAIDGRMQPHEWLSTPTGAWVKTDSLDHHRDHFLPGDADAAWDVAGFIVEWNLGPGERSTFVEAYAQESGDQSIVRRLSFFTAAYAAFRAGYCAMSAQALRGTADGAHFQVLGQRYEEALRLTLATVPSAAPSGR